MNVREALDYIHAVSWKGSRPGLSRITSLMHLLGNPQNKLRFVHVAGTNGKGSFCAMLSSVLTQAGYKTGLFTSPYVVKFNDRMRIDGKDISDEALAKMITEIKPFCDQLEDAPTEFELITAAAFLYFIKNHCDIVVLEAGMGGRLDSTNVISPPVLSVITEIAMDHMTVLGDTIEKIAFEKAGIIKNRSAVLYGGENDEAWGVIREKALSCQVPYARVKYESLHVLSSGLHGCVFSFGGFSPISISLAGMYQPKNACVVLQAIELLRERGLSIPWEAIAQGMVRAKWPARFEILWEDPLVIFDGGHNLQGVTACADSIRHYFGSKKVLVFCGVMKDKAYDEMIHIISPLCEAVFTVKPNNPRALPAHVLARAYQRTGIPARAFETVYEGLQFALMQAKEKNLPLVALGSLYMYEEFKAVLDSLVH